MDHEERITRAAELAERILDEVASADHDWRLVATLANDLAELAERIERASGGDAGADR